MDLTYGRKKLTSSGTGGRRGTAEMLAFCAEHGITADIELLPSARVRGGAHPPRPGRRPLPLRPGHVRPRLRPAAAGNRWPLRRHPPHSSQLAGPAARAMIVVMGRARSTGPDSPANKPLDRPAMTAPEVDASVAATLPEDGSRRRLVARDDLVARLDRAAARRVTIISAPAGSGKTSLLRAWANRPDRAQHIAFVPVRRDEQDAQLFWLTLLNAVRHASGATSGTRTADRDTGLQSPDAGRQGALRSSPT